MPIRWSSLPYCGCPNVGWKRISRHRALQKGVSLWRTKSRDNVGTASAAGQQLLTGQGESMFFVGLWSCSATKSWPTLFEPPPGSSVHGISQVRILEWVAISFSRGSSQPSGGSCISCIGRRILYHWAYREDLFVGLQSIFIASRQRKFLWEGWR